MRKFLGIFLLAGMIMGHAKAQMPPMMGGRAGAGASQNMNIGHFYGKMVDSKTNKGIEGVTVQLRGNKFDTVTKKMKEAILGTVITKANGDFSFENLPLFGNFKLNATALIS